MMKQLTESVHYIGVLNPGMRVFDVVMRTEYGTSYNSYVVKGAEKTAIIETAHAGFAEVYREELETVLGGAAPDYLILNHTEPDHSGCVADLTRWYPGITVLCSQAAAIYLKNITNNPALNLKTVKDGETLSLGGKTLRFVSAPFLHWPDSMFTYLEEEGIAFTCDFLGAHYCEPAVMDSLIAYPEAYQQAAKHYYDCIFAPFAPYVQKGLAKLQGFNPRMACPSHGPVLTPAGRLGEVTAQYAAWSAPVRNAQKKLPIFFCTAYGNTEKLAKAIQTGILSVLPDADVPLLNLIEHDMSSLAAQLNESDAFLLGALTINRDAAPPIWQLLSHVDAVNIAKRPVALFGSFGWSGEAFTFAEQRLRLLKCNVYDEQLKINFVPAADDLARAEAFGATFATPLQAGS